MTAARRNRVLTMLAIGLGTLVFVGANAHLIVVAFESQPPCVEHVKLGAGSGGGYSAAKSSC